MTRTPSGEPSWIVPLCSIAEAYRIEDRSIRELFERAAPDLDDPRFVEMVVRRLEREPLLVEAWQQYSADKRSTPNPFLQGTEVGFVDFADGKVAVRVVERFDSEIDACATFIRHEATWVLERRRVA